ncbi:4Fe-4S ferredoxin [Aeromicrobium sp. PE09-221]|uniref:FAD-dependent oxidoreductase n=1 Tax=Aeromicrobium sp. PE09-221 TaxID=1898043 RepID=UPI000B3EC04C|nr:FAD-dependent oxidoreductase [Aeromicrobium sp. PE09-221]OUZ11001.1 4Fe-4S ferredoxin [Aeromicrobium sp. PE09-221]
MTHVVTRSCCGDASCVYACPVNCIHPTPDEPGFATAEMLYIDPASCVDCGACVSACPVGAIKHHTKLTDAELPFVAINEMFHAEPAPRPPQARTPVYERLRTGGATLRVAIVGAGPAGLYAADELLRHDDVQVTVVDRLPTPHGLVRSGVAPDHPDTKAVSALFAKIEELPGFAYSLGVDVGTDVSHEDLLRHVDAVIYATGASDDTRLGVPGEELPGSHPATSLVGWINGHPSHADASFDLSAERVVIIGNGNVALDIARILATDPERLTGTDISDQALRALRGSRVREIVIVARRGAAQAACTLPELTSLSRRDDLTVLVEGDLHLDEGTQRARRDGTIDPLLDHKISLLESLADRSAPDDDRPRIVFRFGLSPWEIEGARRVEGVRLGVNTLRVIDGRVTAEPTEEAITIDTSLVLRSVGYRGVPLRDLPFDPATGTVPHEDGRVRQSDPASPPVYVTGWIKRGPSGYIGTNKTDAQETIASLVADVNIGRVPLGSATREPLDSFLTRTLPGVVDLATWRAVERFERVRGAAARRSRRKVVDPELIAAVAERVSRPGGRPMRPQV